MPESSKYNDRHLYITAIIIWLLGIGLMPKFCHGWDNYCWGYWSEIIHNKGLTAVYADKSPINYPPLFIYILKAYSTLAPDANFFKYTYCLKALTWAFDVGSLILICKCLPKQSKTWHYLSISALSPAWFYNTMIWNQVDGILAFWVLLAILMAFKGQAKWAIIACIMALNFKIQAIVSLPLIGLICLYNKDYKGLLLGGLIGLILQILILSPFIYIGQVDRVWLMATGSMDYFPYVSMNAHNLWHIVFNGDLTHMPDAQIIAFGLSLKTIGLLLFFVSSAIILWPLIIGIIKSYKTIPSERISLNFEAILLINCLISFVFFYFNTQMHERYIHPSIISSLALAIIYRHWWQWILLGLTYFFSLESLLQFLGLHIYHTAVFHPKAIAVLYGTTAIYWTYLFIKTPLFKKAT
jgi:Gpi18-like mannosyltransferase